MPYMTRSSISEVVSVALNTLSSTDMCCPASIYQYPPPTITIAVPRIVPTFCAVIALRFTEKSTMMIAALPIIVSSGAFMSAELI